MKKSPTLLLLASLVLTAACPARPAPETDAIVDAALDGAVDAHVEDATSFDAEVDANVDGAIDDAAAVSDAGTDLGDAATDAGQGAPVGSPCTNANECASPTTPACLASTRPFGAVAGIDPAYADVGITFSGGYCSSMPSCASDAECGRGGGCFRPFTQVFPGTLRDLEVLLGVSVGALDSLPSYGICMRACTLSPECEAGQLCDEPMTELVGLIPGSMNATKFCVPDPSCVNGGCPPNPCDPSPCEHGGVCTPALASFTCACPDGYSGTRCETLTAARDRAMGQACSIDAQCNVIGTARCLSELHPLMGFLVPGEVVAAYGFDFPHGYCSNETSCSVDVQCGTHAACFAPFRDVTEQTLRELEATSDLPNGALEGLDAYGACLRACAGPLDCFPDQSCGVIFGALTSLVPGSVNEKTFCMPHADCEHCDAHAHCFVNASDEGMCVCDSGYTGNGLACSPSPG